MEELIFFAVIIVFSIIESIARSRRKKAAGAPQIPGEWEPDEEHGRAESGTSGAPTYDAPTYRSGSYDADPSYDDAEASRRSGSEGMIPADVWAEIAGLAETVEKRKAEPVRPAPPPQTLPARVGWGKRTPSVGQQHRVHAAHVGYGTDPSERAPSEQDNLDPLARKLSADVRAVRTQLRSGRHSLRQAVILREVLGPPVSMRPEPRPE